jgi:hypothetical protein
LGSGSSVWILTRSEDNDGSLIHEISGGNVTTVLLPVSTMYVLVGIDERIVTDPALNNNDDIIWSEFAISAYPPAPTFDSLTVSGACGVYGALTTYAGANTFNGPTQIKKSLTVTGAKSLGVISTMNITGTIDVGGVADLKAACHFRGRVDCYAACNIVGALTGVTVTDITTRLTTLEDGANPDNIIVTTSIKPDVNWGAVIGALNERFTNCYTQYGDIEESLNVGSSTAIGNGKIYVNRGATNRNIKDSTDGELILKDAVGNIIIRLIGSVGLMVGRDLRIQDGAGVDSIKLNGASGLGLLIIMIDLDI